LDAQGVPSARERLAFRVRVNASALGIFSENSLEDETYRDYQPMPQALALLQSTK
jgi:hypothetical protein